MDTNDKKSDANISVFILSYNRPDYLREMLLSVLSQTVFPEEIIILDNGSEKGTKDAVKDLLGGRVKWIGTEHNHGAEWNFNRAYNMSDKKYIAVLHDDDRLLPKFIETTVRILELNEELIALSSNGYEIDGTGKRTGFKIIPDQPSRLVRYNRTQLAMRTLNTSVPFASMIYRNEYPRKIPIKTEFGKISDGVFIIDLAKMGDIGIINDLIFEYRRHTGSDSSKGVDAIYFYLRDNYLLSIVEKSDVYPKFLSAVKRKRSRILVSLLFKNLVRNKDIKSFINIIQNNNKKEINILYMMFYIILYVFIHSYNIEKLRV